MHRCVTQNRLQISTTVKILARSVANQSFQQLRKVSLTKKKVMTWSQSLSEGRSSILIRRFRGGPSKPWETLTSSNGNLQQV